MIVHMIGNAHIDPVWLWPWQAGVDEALATCASAVARCEEYPEFIFTRGEAWVYRQIEQIDPDLFGRIRKLIERGQWHVTGGQWIQPDVNLPTLAGLHQQIVRGQRYFRNRFGVSPRVGYNVDSFGHPATLPDILAEHGYLGYVFHRPSQQQTAVPAATFRWRGVGGGEVIGFRIPAPYVTRSDDLYGQIMLSLDAADPALGHVMCFYGVGNHGGGPTKGNIEYILNNHRAFAGAELVFSTPERFFEVAAQKRAQLPVVEHELQGTFPGCYVVMQSIKQEQRRGEHLLTQTTAAIERWADSVHRPALHAQLDPAWEDLLFTEFHDILAGTSVPQAWASVQAMQGRARIVAEEVMVGLTRRWAQRLPKVDQQQIVVMNTGDSEFDGLIEHQPFLDFDAWGDRWLSTPAGRPIPFQFVQPPSTIMPTPGVVFPLTVVPGDAAVVLVRDDPKPSHQTANAPQPILATTTSLQNDHVQITLGPTGIAAIRVAGRDLLGADGIALRLREDKADTWGFHIDRFAGPITNTTRDCAWVVEETGPLRARVRCETMLGRSPVRWTCTLAHDRPTIDVELEVLFAERYRLLQLPIHLAAMPTTWRCGLAGGAINRTPSSVEWPVQGWSHSSADHGNTLSVLTQDANSISLDGEVMSWSLLRATRMAWSGGEGTVYAGRDAFTDQGTHTFQFQLVPAANGPIGDRELTDAANRMASPLVIFDRYEGMNRPPWGNAPPRRLWTPAEHRARKDGRMAHLDDTGGRAVEEG